MRGMLGGLGIGAFAIACCAFVPLVVGSLGGLALAPLIGVSGAAVVLVVLCVALIARRRRACAVERGDER